LRRFNGSFFGVSGASENGTKNGKSEHDTADEVQ